MADNQENILVEFDYQNIAIIDPNKVIDDQGKAKERLVKHENLVMYANLECKVIPRTKLILGASNSDNLRTLSVTSMNFLNPGEKTFLDNAYTDELTGKDTVNGQGVNQQKIERFKIPNKTDEFYYNQITKSNGEPRATDNGLLGIKSITVKINTSFEPVINIKLEDVKGRALFESGNDSPYAAFFNLPYPLFYLTLKGYYGKAVRLPLMLMDFNSTYNSGTGNFEIDLQFYSYKFTIISEITMGAIVATPHMYKSTIEVSPKNFSGGLPTTVPKTETRTQIVEYGTQKIRELYSEYKAKGLIPEDFPEITVIQMQKRIDQFIQKVLDEYSKENLDPLTDISEYGTNLTDYRGEVYYYSNSWFNKYIDTKDFWVVNKGLGGKKIKIYTLSPQFSSDTQTVLTELKELVTFHNDKLAANKTCGKGGSYTIKGGDPKSSEIVNGVTYNTFFYPDQGIGPESIDFQESWKQQKGSEPPDENSTEFTAFQAKFQTQSLLQGRLQSTGGETPKPVQYFFQFEGDGTFVDITDKMEKDRKRIQTDVENELTNALASQIKSKNTELGFVPTIRNILAVIFANGEAFLRLLDEVHTKAWNQRDSAIRKAPIFSEGANPDAQKQSDNVKIPIYPWPEFVVRTPGEKGEEKFETKYPGDPDVINETKAFLYDYWPEVEFVEEYLRGITSRVEPVQEFPSNNEVTDVKRLSLNAIEYPPSNEIYDNKEETKYLFEIYERLILTSFYSKFFKTTTKNSELNTLAEVAGIIESTNIANSLGNENPFLQEKLLNYGFNENNFLPTLKQFSNSGVGQSWQNFERGVFNTPYIKNTVENNSFQILKSSSKKDVLGVATNMFGLSFNTSSEDEDKIRNYITGSTNSSKLDFTDTYPFIDVKWDRKNMVGPSPLPPNFVNFVPILPSSFAQLKDFYDTRKNLTYNSEFKVISNFSGASLAPTVITETPKPFSSYGFKNVKMPSTGMQNADYPYLYLNDLNEFYKERNSKYQYQLPTEGDVFYASKIGRLTKNQTVSMLNTPFFTNAIQESITKFRNFDEHPYTVPAYLFLNSLPLATLREKYTLYSKTTSPNSQQEIESIEYMNYIFATLKKYGAIHKISLPWVLKIGSIWHRYKKWVETGVDILDNSWKPFPYLENFDPITSAATTDYALTLENNQNVDIILQKDSLVGTQTYTQISTGFYPETINDFNVFYQGFRLFTGFTSTDIQSGITSGLRLINSEDSNITVGFSGNPTDPDRYVQLNAWSAYVLTPDKKDCFILPSHGANINQISSECFNDDDVNLIPIVNNDYVFDGSVRSFWSAPTYGYFSTDKIVKPNPDEYLKRVFGGIQTQETFSLRSSTTGYTNISEMFSVFERNVLDEFEKKFLSFSLPKYNYNDIDPEYTNTENSYGNFHLLFNNLMKIPAPPTGLTASLTIKALQTAQINQFAKVIKGFLNNEVIIKYGNPGNFDKKLFYSFSTKPIVDSLILEKYAFSTPNALPSSAGTQTLIGSKLTYPEAWEALLLSIGFSDVDGIAYSNTGSTIFDFFIDNDIAFTPNNIIQLSPIIKIYATKKYQDRNLTPDKFALLVNEYIDQGDKFINKTLDNLFIQLRKKLDGIKILKERTIVSKLEGTQTKLELYQSFKATNDKWISGNDYKTKTLFEDVLLLDSASRNVGDVAVADIYHLRNLLNPVDMNLATSMYTIVNTILVHNKFTVFNVPSYVNFYNVQEATKNAIPKPEGTLELANNLFGTFLDVDYRKSSTKMVCFYPGEPSAHLDTQGAIQGWNSDAFDMRRAADNPLIEDQINKRDYDKSNKVVGFNVDIGPQNQGVFNTFSVSQKNGTSTAESLQLLSEMSRQAGNRNVATQNLSLYNLYKVRSYDCNVTMMGDAMIQPLMWFNLRYVPMFSGPYMIFEVSHNISPGVFTTSFTGVRQKINGPPRQLDFLQSLRTNLVEKIIAKKREDIEKQKQANSKNVLNDRQSIVQNSNGTNSPSNNSECSGVTAYSTYTKLKNEPKVNTTTVEVAKKKIKQIGLNVGIPQQRIDTLQYAIFAQMYLQGGSETNLSGLENNYIGLDLNSNWGKDNETYFSKPGEFFCAKRNDVINPYVKFDSIDKNIEFLYSRWRQRAGLLTEKTAEKIAIFVNTNLTPNGASPSNWFSLPKDAKEKITAKVQKAIDLYDASR